MSRHLTDAALLELVESGASHPHLDACERCRRAFEDAGEALMLARGDRPPDPSPLFWEHLSERVRAAIDADASPATRRAWMLRPAWRPIAVATLIVVFAAALLWRAELGHRGPSSAPSMASSRAAAADVAASVHAAEEDAAEASWQLVADATSNADLETATEAGGFALPPDSADRAALQLTPDEQRELVRLLQEAVARPE